MTPTFEQQSLLIFVIGLFAVLGAVASFTAILKNIALWKATKKPTPEEAALREFATKNDLNNVRCEFREECRLKHNAVDKTFGEIFGILRAQQDSIINKLGEVGEWQRGMERQIGNIEGRMEEQA